jgi:hypothetical protein
MSAHCFPSISPFSFLLSQHFATKHAPKLVLLARAHPRRSALLSLACWVCAQALHSSGDSEYPRVNDAFIRSGAVRLLLHTLNLRAADAVVTAADEDENGGPEDDGDEHEHDDDEEEHEHEHGDDDEEDEEEAEDDESDDGWADAQDAADLYASANPDGVSVRVPFTPTHVSASATSIRTDLYYTPDHMITCAWADARRAELMPDPCPSDDEDDEELEANRPELPSYLADVSDVILNAWADAIDVLGALDVAALRSDAISSGVEGALLRNPAAFHLAVRTHVQTRSQPLTSLIELGVDCSHADERGMDAFDHLAAHARTPKCRAAAAIAHRHLQTHHLRMQQAMRQRVAGELVDALPRAAATIPVDIMQVIAGFLVRVPDAVHGVVAPPVEVEVEAGSGDEDEDEEADE